MKRNIFFLVVSVLAVATFIIVSRLSSAVSPLNKSMPSPVPISISNNRFSSGLENAKTFTFENNHYRLAWFSISPEKLTLINNFKVKRDSEDIIKAEKCTNLSSAGFYDTEDEPLGLWQSGTNFESAADTNSFLNAFMSVSKQNILSISSTVPPDNQKFAFQSGPLLILQQRPQVLKLKQDEFRRRVVGVSTKEGNAHVIVVFGSDGIFSGPELVRLPSLLKAAEPVFGFEIDNAINLDGGSASVFRSETLYLSELNPVGSFLCIKKE